MILYGSMLSALGTSHDNLYFHFSDMNNRMTFLSMGPYYDLSRKLQPVSCFNVAESPLIMITPRGFRQPILVPEWADSIETDLCRDAGTR